MTSNERNFKRDEYISTQHRKWGMDVPCMDLDFVVTEYDHCIPVGLIDYKHENALIDLNGVSAKTLTQLGDMAGIPSFFVRYGHSNQDGWWGDIKEDSKPWFQILPLNMYAHGKDMPTEDNNTKITELVFVTWLYSIRGRTIPPAIAKQLNQ